MNGKENQCKKILRYLQDFGSITPVDALREFSCFRLGARIWDLKHAGYAISTVLETSTNQYGDPVRYARYTLENGGNCIAAD